MKLLEQVWLEKVKMMNKKIQKKNFSFGFFFYIAFSNSVWLNQIIVQFLGINLLKNLFSK